MSFLRKMGRVGGSANMDFANAMGLDESPSGGTKSSYHEDGFKVGTLFRHLSQCWNKSTNSHKNMMLCMFRM